VKYKVLTIAVLAMALFSGSIVSATSDNVLIFQVQTGGVAASEELVVLWNSSDVDVDITDWCLQYSPAKDGGKFIDLKCVTPEDAGISLQLREDGKASFSTENYQGIDDEYATDFKFSAGLAFGGGHIRIVNGEGDEIDRMGWGDAAIPESVAAIAPMPGEVLSRYSVDDAIVDTDMNSVDFEVDDHVGVFESGVYEQEIIMDVCPSIEEIQLEIPEGYVVDEDGDCQLDVCQDLEGLQDMIPEGYEMGGGMYECVEIEVVLEDSVLLITELLPNVTGADTNNEYIEIYNPNDFALDMTGYTLQLGSSFTKQYVIDEKEIEPEGYVALADSVTGLVLPNSTGVAVRLLAPSGTVVSETPTYVDAADDVSWAEVNGKWMYTNQITRAAENKPYLHPVVEIEETVEDSGGLEPCPIGKFRNPDTNRCKNIESAVSALTPCGAGETRNPDTNRCRKVTTTTSGGLTPCRPGQVRNPDTNRCRSIESATSSTLKPCDEGEERNPDTNRCRKVAVLGSSDQSSLGKVADVKVESTQGSLNWPLIAGVFVAVLAHMMYEWRNEIRQSIFQLRLKWSTR